VLHSLKTGLEREFELDVVANGIHWSPDGRSMAVSGRLVDPESGKVVSALPGTANALAWDVDSRHVYRVRDLERITRTDVSNGEEKTVYRPAPDSTLGSLSLSPDGRWIAFAYSSRPTKSAKVSVVPAAGGAERNLLDIPGGMLAVGAWTRDGRRIFFTQTTADAEHKHQGELWVVPFEGGAPRRAGLSMRALRDVRVSPDGTRISFTSGYPETELWVFENFLPQR
jgi:dipeptidyl aminopeptidase/acylaminoacyl peptidase